MGKLDIKALVSIQNQHAVLSIVRYCYHASRQITATIIIIIVVIIITIITASNTTKAGHPHSSFPPPTLVYLYRAQTCQASLRSGIASAPARCALPPPPSFRPSNPITSAAVQ